MSGRRGRGDRLPISDDAEPITREEAVSLIRERYDSTDENGARLVECSALVDVICAARRLMRPSEVTEKLLGGWLPGLPKTMLELSALLRADHERTNDSTTAISALRKEVSVLERRQEDRRKAVKHLRKAARLLGVRPELFYELPDSMLGSRPKSISYRGSVCGGDNRYITPKIEGETAEEYSLRCELNNALVQSVGSVLEAWPIQRYAQYDRSKGGDASLNTLAIRMLWDSLPWQVRRPVRAVWEPYAVVRDILQWIGYSFGPNLVRSTIIDFRAHDHIEERMVSESSTRAALSPKGRN